MIKTKNRFRAPRLTRFTAFLCGFFGMILPLGAHPHVWIEVHNAITFDDQQRVVSIEVHWRFDELYSAFAIQGLDTNNDGKYSSKELAILLKDNLKEMRAANYYTQTLVDGRLQTYSKAVDPEASFNDGYLSMRFSLVLNKAFESSGKTINISTYDPTYYIAMDLGQQQPARLFSSKAENCHVAIKRPQQSEPVTLDDAIATTDVNLARSYAQQFTSQIVIKCLP